VTSLPSGGRFEKMAVSLKVGVRFEKSSVANCVYVLEGNFPRWMFEVNVVSVGRVRDEDRVA